MVSCGRRLAQFLEVDPEIVLRIVVELPETRAALERLRQNFIGERQYRWRQHRQHDHRLSRSGFTPVLDGKQRGAVRHQDAGGTIEVYVVGDPDRRGRGNGNDRTSEAARVTSKPPSAPAQPRRQVGRVEQRHRDVVGCLLGVPVAFVLSYGLQYRPSEPGDRRPKFCRPNDSKVSRTRELCVLKSTTPR
jgi:hypothetical protein